MTDEQGIVAAEAAAVGGTLMRPLGDRVIVIEDAPQERTMSGIFVVSDSGETRRGIVVAKGPGLRSPLTGEPTGIGLSEGDHVIFSPMSGIEITVDGQKLLVLRESDVISVFTEPETDDPTPDE